MLLDFEVGGGERTVGQEMDRRSQVVELGIELWISELGQLFFF